MNQHLRLLLIVYIASCLTTLNAKPAIDLVSSEMHLENCMYDFDYFSLSTGEKNTNLAILFDSETNTIQKAREKKYDYVIGILTNSMTPNKQTLKSLKKCIRKFDLVLISNKEIFNRFSKYNNVKFISAKAPKDKPESPIQFIKSNESAIWTHVVKLLPPLDKVNLEPFLRKIEKITQPTNIKHIDCVYAINLKERPDKWSAFLDQVANFQIGITRFQAINGWLLQNNTTLKEMTRFGSKYEMSHKYNLTWGAIGCFLSHLSILKDAYNRNLDRIWILEDDVLVVSDLRNLELIIDQLNEFDPEWDILYTDLCNNTPCGKKHLDTPLHPPPPFLENLGYNYYKEKQDISDDIIKTNYRGGTYSMIYSKSGIRKVYDTLVNLPIVSPIDNVIHHVKGIKQYALKSDCVTHAYGDNYGGSNTTRPPN